MSETIYRRRPKINQGGPNYSLYVGIYQVKQYCGFWLVLKNMYDIQFIISWSYRNYAILMLLRLY